MKKLITKLQRDYKWLFTKQVSHHDGKVRTYETLTFNPIIKDCGSHWQIARELQSSPLILSKDY